MRYLPPLSIFDPIYTSILEIQDRIVPSDNLATLIEEIMEYLGRISTSAHPTLTVETSSADGVYGNVAIVSLLRSDGSIEGRYHFGISSSGRYCYGSQDSQGLSLLFASCYDDDANVEIGAFLERVTGCVINRLPPDFKWSYSSTSTSETVPEQNAAAWAPA